MLSTIEIARLAFTKGKAVDAVPALVAESWRFSWLLDEKDEPVSRWAFARLLDGVAEITERKGEVNPVMSITLVDIATGLNDWRLGKKKPAWFAEEIKRREEEAATRQ